MIGGDLETTGLLKPELIDTRLQPFITEFYFAKFNWQGKIIDEIGSLVNPGVPIPKNITEITKITDAMVRNKPKFIDFYDALCDFFLGETTFFAHNCSYEIGVLTVELQRHDLECRFPWPKNQICTVEASFPIQNKRLRQEDLYKIAGGKSSYNAHRAEDDTKVLIHNACWLKKNGFFDEAIN